ncbi:hypothetical protein CN380_20020 [Bacillus sp. AFS017274]|nr:hypothetical protein CN380_20020 [Bacillus sp. AFS017274]
MKAEMEKENLITYFDSVGNLFGRLEGTDPSGGIILTDSVDSLAKEAGGFTMDGCQTCCDGSGNESLCPKDS